MRHAPNEPPPAKAEMEQPDLVEAAPGGDPVLPEASDESPALDPAVTVEPPLVALPVAATDPLDGIEPDVSADPVAAVVPAEPGEPVAPEPPPLDEPEGAPLDVPEPAPASTVTLWPEIERFAQ
jgi:hypothetical protein